MVGPLSITDISAGRIFLEDVLAWAAEEEEGAYEQASCCDGHQDDGVSVSSPGGR
jgi:hypothetical protein